jgi:hypothetical protein
MHTLFDYISHVNKIQYALSLLFIAGFIIFTEIMKPRPFQNLLKSAAADAEALKAKGKAPLVRLLRNLALSPGYVLLYLAAVPLLFFRGLAEALSRGIGDVTTAGWSPVRAYFTGRRIAGKSTKNDRGKEPGKE